MLLKYLHMNLKMETFEWGNMMSKKRFLDEQLAKARRIYMEEQIGQQIDKGIWKGEPYTMKQFLLPGQKFQICLPDLFLKKELEEVKPDEQIFTPFLVMLSQNKDIFCSFYNTKGCKIYEPDVIHEMFDILYPDHELSSLESLQNNTLEIFNFHYISKDISDKYYHTIFILHSDTGQIMGHFSGALTELRNLKRMERKILKTIEIKGAVL